MAVTDFCDYPPAVKSKPRVGGFTNPSLEAIVGAKPDLVILTDDGNPKAIYNRLRDLGVPCQLERQQSRGGEGLTRYAQPR